MKPGDIVICINKDKLSKHEYSFIIKEEITVIYSEDEASISSGGYYKINKKTQFVKEFKDV